MPNKVYNVFGLGYGDEGKGSIVESLVHKHGAVAVVRYNGGPQAAHHVVENNRFHCFSQFGSGTLQLGVRTHLAAGMLIKPQNLLAEAQALAEIGIADALSRITISRDAYLVTPLHAMIGQMLEASRGNSRHGSVGMGVGRAAHDRSLHPETSLQVGDLLESREALFHKVIVHFAEKLAEADKILAENPNNEAVNIYEAFMHNLTVEGLVREYQDFITALGGAITSDSEMLPTLATRGAVVLEGAQGVLLDPQVGFAPHVTKTSVLPSAAVETLRHLGATETVVNVGVIRAFATRHGAGPLVTEAELPHLSPGEHNQTNRWQGSFRYGHLDLLATRYAIEAAKQVDCLAVTCLDRLADNEVKACTCYEYLGKNHDSLGSYFKQRQTVGEGSVITEILQPEPGLTTDSATARTKLLLESQPRSYKSFASWPSPEAKADLHPKTREFIQYLESSDGLDTPVAIVASGPAAGDKHHLLDT